MAGLSDRRRGVQCRRGFPRRTGCLQVTLLHEFSVLVFLIGAGPLDHVVESSGFLSRILHALQVTVDDLARLSLLLG